MHCLFNVSTLVSERVSPRCMMDSLLRLPLTPHIRCLLWPCHSISAICSVHFYFPYNFSRVVDKTIGFCSLSFSPPARWGLLDFMSVASSSCRLLPPPRPPCRPCRPRRPRRPRPTATRDPQCSLPDLNRDHPRPVFPAGPQPRPATPTVPCRTSTTTIHAQCSLPDLNREYPRQVFPAGPHVGRYGTKNVQKEVRKNVRKNVRRYARRYAR